MKTTTTTYSSRELRAEAVKAVKAHAKAEGFKARTVGHDVELYHVPGGCDRVTLVATGITSGLYFKVRVAL